MSSTIKKILVGVPFAIVPQYAFAAVPEILGNRIADGIISTVIYSFIGIVMAILSFKAVDWVTPGDLHKLLCEEKNVAIGIVVGLLMLGICIIIASAVVG